MSRYVALLQGINVGRNRRIPMADLRTTLSDLGYGDVATHLQSGNAVFTASDSAADVAETLTKRIADEYGFDVPCVIRDSDQIDAVIERDLLGGKATDPSRYLVVFLSGDPDRDAFAQIDPAKYHPDEFALGEREIYQWCPDGVRNSKLTHTFWGKRLGVQATARNWNTVVKLSEMLRG